MKKKKENQILKLYVRPDKEAPFGAWHYRWLEDHEIKKYKKKGYIRCRNLCGTGVHTDEN
jgi:hypothetical protein